MSFVKANLPFAGELYMGHLRYSTTGKSGLSYVHPFLRRNNWKAKNLCMCGNFNMTNIEDIFEKLTDQDNVHVSTVILICSLNSWGTAWTVKWSVTSWMHRSSD